MQQIFLIFLKKYAKIIFEVNATLKRKNVAFSLNNKIFFAKNKENK